MGNFFLKETRNKRELAHFRVGIKDSWGRDWIKLKMTDYSVYMAL